MGEMMKSAFRQGDFLLVRQTAFSGLQQEAREKRIGLRDLRVFLEMLANTGHDNMVMTSQITLGQLTGMDLPAVYRSVRALLLGGFIERIEGRRGWYRVTPRFAWKGNGEQHRQALAQELEAAYLARYDEVEEVLPNKPPWGEE